MIPLRGRRKAHLNRCDSRPRENEPWVGDLAVTGEAKAWKSEDLRKPTFRPCGIVQTVLGEDSCLDRMRETFRRLKGRSDYIFLAARTIGGWSVPCWDRLRRTVRGVRPVHGR